jgi:hypothetical protein
MLRVFGLTLAWLGAIGAPALAQLQPAAINLQPDWETGQQSRYSVQQTRTRTRTLMAGGKQREATTTTRLTGEITWRVESVAADGSATCTLSHDWLKLVMTGPEGNQKTNDTRRGSGDLPPVQQMLSALSDNPLTVQVAADGTVTGVDGGDAIRSALDNPQFAPTQQDLHSTAESLVPLPAAPSDGEVGRTWRHSFGESHALGSMQYDANYELAGVETVASIPIATIRIQGDITLDAKSPQRPANAPEMTTDLRDSHYRSFVIFDLLRREAVGRYTSEQQVIEQNITARGRTLTQRMNEQTQATVLRISEQ